MLRQWPWQGLLLPLAISLNYTRSLAASIAFKVMCPAMSPGALYQDLWCKLLCSRAAHRQLGADGGCSSVRRVSGDGCVRVCAHAQACIAHAGQTPPTLPSVLRGRGCLPSEDEAGNPRGAKLCTLAGPRERLDTEATHSRPAWGLGCSAII